MWILFFPKKGYVINQKYLTWQMKIKNLRENLLVVGAMGAMIGTVSLTLFEVQMKIKADHIHLYKQFFPPQQLN